MRERATARWQGAMDSTRDDHDQPRFRRSGKGEATFRGHLTVYLVTGAFLFSLNVLTSPGDWWFYWPLFFWGWAVVFQAVATYGADAPTRVMQDLRSIVPGLESTSSKSTPRHRRDSRAAPFAATAFASVHERIQCLELIVEQIPAGTVRDQAARICDAANRIVAAMAAARADARTVASFETNVLVPAEALLERYIRLRGHDLHVDDEALRQVEHHDLPLLASRLEALSQRLHRGETIDLTAVSEVLDLEPLESPPYRRSDAHDIPPPSRDSPSTF